MLRYLVPLLVLAATACAPIADGELERKLDFETNNRLTHVEGRQDFRTFRQKMPSFLLP